MFGPSGITQEDLDFDPAQLVPANLDLPGLGLTGTRAQRARAHMENFEFTIVPNSVYQMTQSTRRMMLLQLARAGMPISPKTIMEQFDIPDPDKEAEAWKEWQKEQALMAVEVQAAVAEASMQMDPMGTMMGTIQNALGAAGKSGGNQGPGRKPSGQKPPHLEVKSDGMGGERSTIAES